MVGAEHTQCLSDNSREYQTANELFEIMGKNDSLDCHDGTTFIPQDLVILYKNIDTKAVSSINEKKNCSNQYVEAVKYNDDPGSEDSDVSENFSNEDFNDVFDINKERIDLLNNISSFESTLCHKYDNLEIMRTSYLAAEYNKHFLLNNSYIKQQLRSFHAFSNSKQSDSTFIPASLLDYICSKHLEENYNFYMDNIITYVKHTIEQLKRISNGDYLSEKAKQKWREIDERYNDTHECKNTVIASSFNIPLRLNATNERRRKPNKSTWDDTVHSEMDVRCMSKILEKKIIVELPKILCGSYRLFRKQFKDNLIITCTKDTSSKGENKNEEAHVEVILKLQRSKADRMINNIDSIMILKALPFFNAETESSTNKILALEFNRDKQITQENNIKLLELDNGNIETPDNIIKNNATKAGNTSSELLEDNCYNETGFLTPCKNGEYNSKSAEAEIKFIQSDDLQYAIHRLKIQSPVLEENEDILTKNKSPTRLRIKSPYQNQSHFIEDKKRKKLLEIRDKREKKKMVMNENCKISKHKFGRGAAIPQSSNSVTKLSITNKSFYNSIYGHTMTNSNKNSRKGYNGRIRTSQETIPEIHLDYTEIENRDSSLTTPEKNCQKYIDRSYYLDNTDTEVMYLQMKRKESQEEAIGSLTPSTVELSANDIGANLSLLKQIITPSTINLSVTDTSSSLQQNILFDDDLTSSDKVHRKKIVFLSPRKSQLTVPTNTPKKAYKAENGNSKIALSIECRRSIDKIYDLMNQTDNDIDITLTKSKIPNNIDMKIGNGSSTVPASDSGTSIKHQLTSSNPSCFSFEKTNTVKAINNSLQRKYETQSPVVPKVVISSKLQSNKIDVNKIKKEGKKPVPSKIHENPLKAISQLLHKFDSVQKTRHKSGNDLKRNKKSENSINNYKNNNSHQISSKRTPRLEQQPKESAAMFSKVSVPKERRRNGSLNDHITTTHQQISIEEKLSEGTSKKKISDILDEVKELRGEAVRGPSKKLSRLNSLAQPKRTYLQAHNEEFLFKKRDRQQKPITPIIIQERNVGAIGNKYAKSPNATTTSKYPHITGSPLEKGARTRRSTNNSPSSETNGKRSPVFINRPSYTQINDASGPLNRKMVAVETYVKSHFGRLSASNMSNNSAIQKSRVPLIPHDIDLASTTSSPSTEESNNIGKKLHYMIDSMINNGPVLTAVTECNESTSKLDSADSENITDSLKYSDIICTSDYSVDILEDQNIITAVSNISENSKDHTLIKNYGANFVKCNTGSNYPSDELKKLENALYRQISTGTFQKRLRIKNLTLTPKQSMEKFFILQSGDTGSFVLKSTVSQKIEIPKTDISELKTLPVLSSSCMDWRISNCPMQVATVGYVFPHHLVKCHSTSKVIFLNDKVSTTVKEHITSSKDNITKSKANKDIQCFKGGDNQVSIEKNYQVDILQFVKTDCVDENSNESEDKKLVISGKTLPNIEKESKIDIDVQDPNSNNINNTTSLDILVRLLSEIKKITSFQADITKSENDCGSNTKSKELQIIHKNSPVQIDSVNYSVDNLDTCSSYNNFDHLDKHVSKYSLFSMSNNKAYGDNMDIDKKSQNTSLNYFQRINIDKEVSVDTFRKEYVHTFTDVPYRFEPVSVGTHVSDSLIKLINVSTKQSIHSFSDIQSINKTIISNEVKTFQIVNSGKSTHSFTCPMSFDLKHCSSEEKFGKIELKKLTEKNQRNVFELDPTMKMKRDILVTVYSILVFTVFAALSFPEIIR